ncbi:MAG TPA: sigma-54 dependent transcriptional regulator [Candidatus Cloacimonadota bacterium]|nr:sigma-54 dependent transcriptional regulator [Candidatus Cloacimonadota bacterium]HPS37777.1 sigma-54 dependent transcriptional regulator [Candidatus Cloacimonadota bacterium]
MPDIQAQLLIVDDSPDTLEMLRRKLGPKGFSCHTATSVNQALEIIDTIPIELVLTDYKMPQATGLDLIRHLHENHPRIKVIMITGYPTIEGAIEAVKVGAEEYLTKPFTDEELFEAINQVMIKVQQQRLADRPHQTQSNPYGMIGTSAAMTKVYSAIRKSCSNNATVLIQGESGTGKELVARAIHYHSKRAKTPFVPVNCGAIPETLLEAELFGYTKGSFTGAIETRAGYFITADGGTIFLDEISETSLSMQVKLLRVLQDRQVAMIGSKSPRPVNIRVIASTNKDLSQLIRQGGFREDLFYRLNVLPIHLPPLRERIGDIPLLVYHFLEKYARENSAKIPSLSPEVMTALENYHWQGNVRELENLIYRLVVMSEDQPIQVSDLPEYMKFSLSHSQDLTRSLAEVERQYINDVLNSVNGNKSLASRILRVDRKTLHNKLKEL